MEKLCINFDTSHWTTHYVKVGKVILEKGSWLLSLILRSSNTDASVLSVVFL